MFTPGEIIAIFTGLGLLVTAIGAVIVNIIMSLKSKVDKIAVSVDGATTAAAEREKQLRDKIELIERFMKEKDARAEKRESANLSALAGSVPAGSATASPMPVVVQNVEPVPVTEVKPK